MYIHVCICVYMGTATYKYFIPCVLLAKDAAACAIFLIGIMKIFSPFFYLFFLFFLHTYNVCCTKSNIRVVYAIEKKEIMLFFCVHTYYTSLRFFARLLFFYDIFENWYFRIEQSRMARRNWFIFTFVCIISCLKVMWDFNIYSRTFVVALLSVGIVAFFKVSKVVI